MWQRLGNLKISCDLAILSKVTRNKGWSVVVVPLGGDRQVVVISLKLIMSKPRLTSPPDMSSAGVL
jgi:hypothetical protein